MTQPLTAKQVSHMFETVDRVRDEQYFRREEQRHNRMKHDKQAEQDRKKTDPTSDPRAFSEAVMGLDEVLEWVFQMSSSGSEEVEEMLELFERSMHTIRLYDNDAEVTVEEAKHRMDLQFERYRDAKSAYFYILEGNNDG